MSTGVRLLPKESDFTAPAHDARVTSRVGLWLGVAFTVCFVTGLLSHAIQHPPGWFAWPTRPVGLYRVNQGLHVISGVAAVPLLLAKLWTVYPKLFARPTLRSVAHALDRLSVLVLIAAALFELATGLLNATQSYPWRFFFPPVHYAVGWLAIGALAVHLGLKLPIIRDSLAAPVSADVRPSTHSHSRLVHNAPGAEPRPAGHTNALSRRAFLGVTGVTTGAAVLATAGVAVPWLRRVSVLDWTSGTGPQGLPVNRTAAAADIDAAVPWTLTIAWPGGGRVLTLDELSALPQRTAELPIACVEGWSASATWTGVPVRDLLAHAGAPAGHAVHVESAERGGIYSTSTLPAAHAADPLTLLALRLNGEVLNPDHGYPARIIAPSRPGVLQTKWVRRLEVLP
jgi:DMSO/TMAO reductase YedYZ molybdopterin-dependent catalytic subunit